MGLILQKRWFDANGPLDLLGGRQKMTCQSPARFSFFSRGMSKSSSKRTVFDSAEIIDN